MVWNYIVRYNNIANHKPLREYKGMSKVCPWMWVESFIHWTRLKDSMRLRNSLDKGLDWQHMWMLKHPTIKTVIVCGDVTNKWIVELLNEVLDWVRWMINHSNKTGPFQSRCKSWASKLVNPLTRTDRHSTRNELFKIVTNPPPRLFGWGVKKNVQSAGTNSENGIRSPTFVQDSVINIKSRLWESQLLKLTSDIASF